MLEKQVLMPLFKQQWRGRQRLLLCLDVSPRSTPNSRCLRVEAAGGDSDAWSPATHPEDLA